MSIQNKIRILNRAGDVIKDLIQKYPSDSPASSELKKLDSCLKELENYLVNLDRLQPNYTTNEIEKHLQAVNLNVVILKKELEKQDYRKLINAIKVVKVMLKFHPTKYSFLEFIILWIYELIYFV
jgi:hypothetical protein